MLDCICGEIMFKFGFIMEYFILSVMVTERSSGYSSLTYHLWSLRVCSTSVWVLLDFCVFFERTVVIPMLLCLYASLFLLKILIFFLCSIKAMFRLLCAEEIFLKFSKLFDIVCFLYLYRQHLFFVR